MNKVIAGLLAAALFGGSYVMADVGASTRASKDLKKIVEEGPYVETAKTGVKLSGYVDAGYSYNFNGGGSTTAGLVNADTRFSGDRAQRGDFNLNAVKIALEKPLTDANELQAGFRADVMLGEDAAFFGQNAGGSDSVFLEQAYVQFRLPYGNGVDFKVGKFVTLLGYEVIERPVNMNITYGNIFQNSIPLWNTGVVAKYDWNDTVTTQFGVVNNANDDNGIGLDGSQDNVALTGSIDIKAPGGNANIYQAFYYGVNGDEGAVFFADSDNSALFIYDVWGNWVPKFANDKLLLALNFNFGTGKSRDPLPPNAHDSTTWTGVAAYAKYQFTDIFSLAGRFDYIHNDDSQNFTAVDNGRSDIYSTTVTAGFDIIENMQLRTEYRADWGKDLITTTGATSEGPLHTVAAQVVYSF